MTSRAIQVFGLPAVPAGLKAVGPYLQRADELKSKEPIMAYWCAYYAAQVGISLNSKEGSCREFLFDLLGLLESMKKEIGPNDAIDMESASAAYVENFAIKVFTLADNEDRKGAATKSTAAKFLAASHFLDVLKTFPQSELTESHDDKIRYAKWKAADIAKALREGRKPTAGPAGGEPEPEIDMEIDIPQAPEPTVPNPYPQLQAPHLSPDDWTETPGTPGNWSTAATPGGSSAGHLTPVPPSPPALPPPPPFLHQDTTESICDGDLGEGPAYPQPSAGLIARPSAPPLEREDSESGLSPLMVSKAQKHCRYAISALDYEDRATAKKELRAALAILEG